MKTVFILMMLVLGVACQNSGGGSSGIIVGHVPVADEFTLTTTTNTNYLNGQTISFNLTFPVAITVTGTPKLSLTIGTASVDADFVSVASNVMTFQYTVQPGDEDSDGISVSTTLNKNGGTIQYRGTTETSTVVVVPSLFSVRVNSTNGLPPVATAFSDNSLVEDTQKILNLPYTDADGHQATSCSISDLSNVTVTQACACAAGVCTVGVTGTANYNGSAGFNFTVTANSETSNSAAATLTIASVDDLAVASNVSPPNFNEDVQSVITLSYSDVDGQATACNLSNLSNVTITQACACSSGTCTVGVTGTPQHYHGAGGFDYTVTSNGNTSNTASVSFVIDSVLDAPTTANLNPPNFNEDTQSIITLTHTVVGGDVPDSCALTGLSNVFISQACSCVAGTCTVGVTGNANYNGAASFNWTVSAGTAQSTSRSASFSIIAVDDVASLGAISAKTTNKNTPTASIAFTFTDNDGAVCNGTRLSMTSSDPAVVANTSVTWGGTAPNCTAIITPVTNATGPTNIIFTATDGGLADKTTSFTLTVNGAHLVWLDPGDVVITQYDFGTPGANTNVTLKVKNVGNISTSSGIGISDSNSTPRIALNSTTCSGTLASNATCDVTINWINTGGGGNGLKTEDYTATAGSESAMVTIMGTK